MINRKTAISTTNRTMRILLGNSALLNVIPAIIVAVVMIVGCSASNPKEVSEVPFAGESLAELIELRDMTAKVVSMGESSVRMNEDMIKQLESVGISADGLKEAGQQLEETLKDTANLLARLEAAIKDKQPSANANE